MTRFCLKYFFFFSPISNTVSYISGLNRLNFLLSTIAARANRCAYRNGNTVVPVGRGEKKGDGGRERTGDVTKSLWRNILLIHVRLYNLAHFYSKRGAARRIEAQCRYGIFVPYFPNFMLAASSFLKRKREKKKRENVPFLVFLFSYKI